MRGQRESESDSSDQSKSNIIGGLPVDQNCYIVEAILDKKTDPVHGVRYLVSWQGWPIQDSTWEPVQHLNGVEDMLRKFQLEWQPKNRAANEDKVKAKRKLQEQKQKEQQIKRRKQKQLQRIQKVQKMNNQNKQSEEKKRKIMIKKLKPIYKQKKDRQKRASEIQISSDQASQNERSYKRRDESGEEGEIQQSKSVIRQIDSRKGKPVLKIGAINTIYVNNNNEIQYEVDIVNKAGTCIGVKLVSNKQIKQDRKQLVLEYLETYLKQQDMARRGY